MVAHDDKDAVKKEYAERKSLPSSYEESPPHIMDHDYARPPSGSTPGGGEPFANDHGGYAKPSPDQKPAELAAKPAKPAAKPSLLKKPPPPAVVIRKPVAPAKKWQVRSPREDFDVLYR